MRLTSQSSVLKIEAPVPAEYESILNAEAVTFVLELHERVEGRRGGLAAYRYI
jgi:hypothetical protein